LKIGDEDSSTGGMIMLRAVRGHYKDGEIELYENPDVFESNVIVTFIDSEEPEYVDLQARGISKDDARNLRSRLRAFEDDWNAEGMELYDKL
jgi:hypothetical protein